MTTKAAIQDFVSQKNLAIIGVSRTSHKFGNMAYKELKAKGYRVYAIHPSADTLEGEKAYKDFASLPVKVEGAVIVLPPVQAEKVVHDAVAAGIKRIWMQQGSESEAAVKFCRDNGVSEVHGECIMMYAVGTGLHGFHAWVWKVLGKSPKD